MIHRVLSPHLDDAVLSLGQFMAAEPCVVHTVFAGIPEAFGLCTDYDRAHAFPTSHTAMTARRQEDADACAVLGALPLPMSFLDAQYRTEAANEEEITSAIAALIDHRVHLFAPLGIGHDDHRTVGRCARAAVASCASEDRPVELLAYECLPYRVDHPEEVFERLVEVRDDGWIVDDLPYPLPQGARSIKEAALRCYRSQLGDDLEPSFLVGERCWRLTR